MNIFTKSPVPLLPFLPFPPSLSLFPLPPLLFPFFPPSLHFSLPSFFLLFLYNARNECKCPSPTRQLIPWMGDGTYSETVTQSDSVISAVVEWVSCLHAAVLVLSQFGQQLFQSWQGQQFPGGLLLGCAFGSCSWKFNPDCFFHLFKESVSYLINAISFCFGGKRASEL